MPLLFIFLEVFLVVDRFLHMVTSSESESASDEDEDDDEADEDDAPWSFFKLMGMSGLLSSVECSLDGGWLYSDVFSSSDAMPKLVGRWRDVGEDGFTVMVVAFALALA